MRGLPAALHAPALLLALLASGCSSPWGPSELQGAWEGTWASPYESQPFTLRENAIRLEISDEGDVDGGGSLELYRSWETGWQLYRVELTILGLLLQNGDLRLICEWTWEYRGEELVPWRDSGQGRTVLQGNLTDQVAFRWPEAGPSVIRGWSLTFRR